MSRPAAAALLLSCSSPDGGETGAICGNHVLDPGEACDGEGDGCDATCHLTGEAAWTATRSASMVIDVAVGGDGTIVVYGAPDRHDPAVGYWLRALDAGGEQQWEVAVDVDDFNGASPHLEIGDDGGIFVQGSTLRRYGPEGELAWQVTPTNVVYADVAVAEGAVYVSGAAPVDNAGSADKLRVERRDPATGAIVWQTLVGDGSGALLLTDTTVTRDSVITVGHLLAQKSEQSGAVRFSVDAATGAPGPVVRDRDEYWHSIGALPSGDLVLVGYAAAGPFVRRLGVDGETRWTYFFDFTGTSADGPGDLAIGPDGSVVVLTEGDLEDGASEAGVRSFSSDGQLDWSTVFPSSDADGQALTIAAAFGPGFLAVVGDDVTPAGSVTWVRKLGPT
ncbi:hypothetical protein [Nannocystis sp.]|uniref:hypothetical protein n=1 Tax=Nannocystis sp. TaxID=1962667 RepID=UPI0025E91A3A|nr:hypothetical protein [Nannocystis sp.]MBK7827086.1 hypothetical protein [Nannocystis sp.]